MKVKLTTKLSVIVAVATFVTVAALGTYFDSFLKENYFEDANARIENAKINITQDIKEKESSLRQGLDFIEEDETILASVSLINEYQNIQDYNAPLLDEEKKSLAEQLLKRVKISLNSDIALYDKDGNLIAFIDKEVKGYRLNFISYENSKMVLYSKTEFQESYQKTPLKMKTANIALKHVAYYTQKELRYSIPITHHFFNNSLYSISHKSIFDGNNTLMHIEMSHKIDYKYLANFSKNLGVHCYFSKSVQGKEQKSGGFFESENQYFTLLDMKVNNANLSLVLDLDKFILKKTLDENREDLILFLLVIIILILGVLYFLFEHTLISPLDKLMQNIFKIKNADYSPSEIIQSGDELQEISLSIKKLAHAVKIREKNLMKTQKKLEYLAEHDDLTNLYNRRAFDIYLQDALANAQKNQTTLAILFLDLDQFKQVNDTLGHNVGDELLIEVSKRILLFVGKRGVVARKGGDEFQLFIEDVKDVDFVQMFANSLLTEFQKSFTCKGKGFEIYNTVSIGIALYPKHGENYLTLMKNADLAMYSAKVQGRNRYSFYTSELSNKIQERAHIIDALRFALKNTEEFFLLYQPKISIKTGKIVGVEALVRWKSSMLGAMRPDEFIGIAEDTHMIIEIGKWVLKRACEDFMVLKKSGYLLKQMSVNLSAIQLQYSDFYATLLETMHTSGIQSSELELEITESYIATNASEAIESLKQFRALGIELAIDDFGTGYSSMSYLQKLPVTRLKIDKSFVDDLPDSKESVAVATAIMALASTFGLKITVEGVETLPQLEFFKEKYCDDIQGYFYSKPLDFESLKTFMQNNLNL